MNPYRLPTSPDAPMPADVITRHELARLVQSVGELRIGLNTLAQKVDALERRLDKRLGQLIGSIEGLEGEWTVTPPPEWEGE